MYRKIAIGMLLCLSLTVSALAIEVPTEIVTQNINGSQQCVKTFSVSPDTDPKALIEKPFTLDGFTYTYASMTKQENRLENEEELLWSSFFVTHVAKEFWTASWGLADQPDSVKGALHR